MSTLTPERPAATGNAVDERLEEPVALVSRRVALGLSGLALLLAAAGAWGYAGSVPRSLTLSGLLLHGSGLDVSRAPEAGALLSVKVGVGQRVSTGQSVATIQTTSGPVPINATNDGVVAGIVAVPGTMLAAGSAVTVIDPTDEAPTAELFVTARNDLDRLAAGQRVVVGFDGTALTGQITAIAAYPESSAQLAATLAEPVPGLPSAGTAVWTVRVSLAAAPAAETFAALTPVQAEVELPSARPYQIVFGS